MQELTEKEQAALTRIQEEIQPLIDAMLKTGQYRKYVKQRKLHLLMGEDGQMLDNLLKLGYLKS